MKFALSASLLALVTLSSSAPVSDAAIATRAVAHFYPTLAVNIFTPDKGTVKGDVYVFRFTQNGIHETTSLLSIPFPAGNNGKTCSFAFAAGWAPSQTNPNVQRVNVFSVGGTISAADTYTDRPARGESYGIFGVSSDGAVATWDGATPTFPCPADATTIEIEVAPEGDFDDVSWPLDAGLAVIVL